MFGGSKLRRTVLSFRRFSTTTPPSPPCIELREYLLKPEKSTDYVDCTKKAGDLRKSLVPLRLFGATETGGSPLNTMTHLYFYSGGLIERESKRTEQGKHPAWQEYLGVSRPCITQQRSSIFVEAPFVATDDRIPGFQQELVAGQAHEPNCIYELRKYQLKLGYDTVPKFLSHYQSGLDSKLSAEGSCKSTMLCSVLYSEIGSLNEVIEVWRHGNGVEAMIKSRNAARSALPWREAIGKIAELSVTFTTTIIKPTSFSNWL